MGILMLPTPAVLSMLLCCNIEENFTLITFFELHIQKVYIDIHSAKKCRVYIDDSAFFLGNFASKL